jgi:hypothetical protein
MRVIAFFLPQRYTSEKTFTASRKKEKYPMRFNPAAIIILSISSALLAEQTAITADGKTVLLNDNGTWRYVNTSAQKPDTSAAVNTGSLFEVVKNSAEFDFRSVRWGMSKREVLAAEKTKPAKSEPSKLEYEMRLFGYECGVVYTFTGDKLTGALLHIRQEHVDPELFYQDYENLKKQLVPLFGEFENNQCNWKNDIYRSDRSKWGFAVSLGFLTCSTRWKTVRTAITLNITGSNHQITTVMEYYSQVK